MSDRGARCPVSWALVLLWMAYLSRFAQRRRSSAHVPSLWSFWSIDGRIAGAKTQARITKKARRETGPPTGYPASPPAGQHVRAAVRDPASTHTHPQGTLTGPRPAWREAGAPPQRLKPPTHWPPVLHCSIARGVCRRRCLNTTTRRRDPPTSQTYRYSYCALVAATPPPQKVADNRHLAPRPT